MKTLVIFGNGLGMAIDPNAYDLTSAMNRVWEANVLSDEHKSLITACLPNNEKKPKSEEHLGTLQKIVAACEILLQVMPKSKNHWLTADGKEFPESIKRFTFEVSKCMYFAAYSNKNNSNYGQSCRLPAEFLESFIKFCNDFQPHIATLNYDGLLASTFEERGLLSEPSNIFRDGFIENTFDRRNLFRPQEKGAWYLHLHGCPLFSTGSGGKLRKFSRKTIENQPKSLKNVGQHVVLTHADHKMSIINSSEILKVYWEFLDLSVDQSDRIILFGYSGNDTHLNRIIAQGRSKKEISVVEWLGAGGKAGRQKFWSDQLGGDINLIQKEDVLHFRDWEG